MHGYGRPIYLNVPYPFKKNPPYIQHEYNPVGSEVLMDGASIYISPGALMLFWTLSDAAGSDPKSYTNKLLDVALKAGI